MQTMIPATFDRKRFDLIAKDLSDEQADAIAKAHADMFEDCYTIGTGTKASPAKAKPNPVDFATVKERAWQVIRRSPDMRSEEIAAAINVDKAITRRAIFSLMNDDKVYAVDGITGRAARFKAKPAANGAAEADAAKV